MSAQGESGQITLNLVVAAGILAILSAAIFTLTNTAFELIGFTRARISARHIAQEKIEEVRNMPFDDVGTIGGIPSGNIPQNSQVNRNGLGYSVNISVIYVDDPFDDIAPTDLLPADYKRVRVDVSWGGIAGSSINPVTMITDIAPNGIETTAGGGTLSILVFDANAVPVPQADVTITANETAPPVHLQIQTSDNGRAVLPGAPTCISCYDITVTKDGFSTDRTYTTAEVTNPLKPPVSIIEGELSEVSFAIDKFSSIDISTHQGRASNFAARPLVDFVLRGAKLIGTDEADEPVYKYEKILTTDGLGLLSVADLEWDNYSFILQETSSYDIAGTNPINPISVLPNTASSFAIALVPETPNSLLAIFTDGINALEGVSANLTDTGTYDETILSGLSTDPDFGQAFFSGLNVDTYTLDATLAGFEDFNGTVAVTGDTTDTTIMTTP